MLEFNSEHNPSASSWFSNYSPKEPSPSPCSETETMGSQFWQKGTADGTVPDCEQRTKVPHLSWNEGTDGGSGDAHSVSCSCDLFWFGLADSKVPQGLKSCWHWRTRD